MTLVGAHDLLRMQICHITGMKPGAYHNAFRRLKRLADKLPEQLRTTAVEELSGIIVDATGHSELSPGFQSFQAPPSASRQSPAPIFKSVTRANVGSTASRILSKWVQKALEAIPGWKWEPADDQYDLWLQSLRTFVAEDGWSALKRETRDASGAALGNWVNWVRHQHRCDRLPDWVLLALDGMDGWSWQPIEAQQRAKVEMLRKFIESGTRKRWCCAIMLGCNR